jgi:hypothetical protein
VINGIAFALERAGLPLDGLAALTCSGNRSLGFIDSAGQDVFTPLEPIVLHAASSL